MVRKSFQLELVTEIGQFVNDLTLAKKTLKINEKYDSKKSKLYNIFAKQICINPLADSAIALWRAAQ